MSPPPCSIFVRNATIDGDEIEFFEVVKDNMWSKISRAIWCVEGDLRLKKIYISLGSPYPAVICINNEGDLVWEIPTERPVQLIRISSTSNYLYLYQKKQKLPHCLTCMDFQGNIVWKKFLEEGIHSVAVLSNGDGCIIGTQDSQIILFNNRGEKVDSLLLEKWSNNMMVHVIDHNIMVVSKRGFLHIIELRKNKLIKKTKVNLKNGVSRLRVMNDRVALLDSCSKERNILHLYNSEGGTYFDINYSGMVNDFIYTGNRIWAVVDNSIITMFDENQGFVFAKDLKFRINDLTADSFGSYVLVATDDFSLHFMDHTGKTLWGKRY